MEFAAARVTSPAVRLPVAYMKALSHRPYIKVFSLFIIVPGKFYCTNHHVINIISLPSAYIFIYLFSIFLSFLSCPLLHLSLSPLCMSIDLHISIYLSILLIIHLSVFPAVSLFPYYIFTSSLHIYLFFSNYFSERYHFFLTSFMCLSLVHL